MKEDLKVSQALSDTPGECRAFGNLGAAYFHQNQLDLAFENHNKQLQIAEKLQVSLLLRQYVWYVENLMQTNQS